MARGNSPQHGGKKPRDRNRGPCVVRTSPASFPIVVTKEPCTFYAPDISISLQRFDIQYAPEIRYAADGNAG